MVDSPIEFLQQGGSQHKRRHEEDGEPELDYDEEFAMQLDAELSQVDNGSPDSPVIPSQKRRRSKTPERKGPPVRHGPIPPSIDILVHDLEDLFRIEANADNHGCFPLFVNELERVLLSNPADHRLITKAVDVLYAYVEGDRVFEPNDPSCEVVLKRLTRDYNVPVLELVTAKILNLYECLTRKLCLVKSDPDLLTELDRRLKLVKARAVHALGCGSARVRFYETMSKYWSPVFDSRFDPIDEGLDKFQRAVIAVLNYCVEHDYCLMSGMNDTVYEPVRINGVFCRAFRPVPHGVKDDTPLTVCDLVASRVPNDPLHPDAFKETCVSNYKQVASYIVICSANNSQLPMRRKNFYLIAFRNGTYNTKEDTFRPHDSSIGPEDCDENIIAGRFIDADLDFVPDRTASYYGVDGRVSCDADFKEQPDDFMNTPNCETPITDEIINWQYPQTQEEQDLLPPHERTPDPRLLKRFLFSMFGRLLFPQNELDNFETFLMIVGVAGCGKSMIVSMFDGGVYEPGESAVMTGSSESTFGISQLDGKRAMFVTECGMIGRRGNKGLNEDDLLKLASCDRSEVRIKYQTPHAATIKLAMLLVGNKAPEWHNAENAMGRRVVYHRWNRVVPPSRINQNLKTEHSKELPNFIVKIARAYRWLLHYMRSQGIKHIQSILPRHVRLNILSLGGSSSVYEFLNQSGDYFYDPTTKLAGSPDEFRSLASNRHTILLYLPYSKLHEAYLEWCSKNKKDPYGRRRGDMNTSEAMIDWSLAFERIYPNAGFIRNPETNLPAKVRADYPRPSRSEIEAYFVQNIELVAQVTESEKDAIQSMQEFRSLDQVDQAMFANNNHLIAEDLRQQLAKWTRLKLANPAACPGDEAAKVKRSVDEFLEWFNGQPRDQQSSPENRLARTRCDQLKAWLRV